MQENSNVRKNDSFPIGIFMAYVVFYAGQAVYNCFKVIFMDEKGFTQQQMGWVGSVSTILLILIQPLLGTISDRSKSKGFLVTIMLAVLAANCLALYIAPNSLLWIAAIIIMYTLLMSTTTNLQDNYVMEYLRGSERWHFGNIRMAGTLGYVACGAVIGTLIPDDRLQSMFWIAAIFYFPAAAMMLFMPKVKGERKQKEKVDYRILLKNRPLIVMFLFRVITNIGSGFGGYYNIYFRNDLGASTTMVALMTTLAAMTEIPIFWFAGRIERNIGVKKFMAIASFGNVIRFVLLFFASVYARSIPLILCIQVFSGVFGAIGMYCYPIFINNSVPRSMTATAQTLAASLNMVVTSIIFSPIIGWFSDQFGPCNILIIGAAIELISVVFFLVAFPKAIKWQKEHPVPELQDIPIINE